MSTTTDASIAVIIAQLQETGLIPPDKLAEFIPPAASPTDAASFTAQLAERGLLTKFQAQQAATGKAKSLVIGSYVMLDRLTGTGGLLFKAQQRRMKRTVFIKPLPPSLMKNALARVQRDVETAGQTANTNLVAVQDLDEVGGAHFLVTEFVDGTDLATLVKQQGKLAIGPACGYAAQAAAGLASAHAQGLMHRDVKAENLFVDRAGVVKVFGLGIAPTETGDAAGDVLALGRTLYRLLSGAELPAAPPPLAPLRTVRPDASAALEAYLARMTSAAPAERPTMAEIAVALKSVDTLPQPAAAEPEGDLFPELFAEAEADAGVLMPLPTEAAAHDDAMPDFSVDVQSSFEPSAGPDFELDLLPAPPPTAATPIAAAPMFADAPMFGDATQAFTPSAPVPSFLDPLPAAPSPMVQPAVAPVPDFGVIPDFAVNAAAPTPPVVAPAAPAPTLFSVPVMPPTNMVPEVAPVETPGGFAISFAAAPPTAPSFAVGGEVAAPTMTSSAPPPRKKSKGAKKPIALPFNLQLDPKYLETKYVAGAGAGVILMLSLLVWMVAGGSKSSAPKVKATPVVKKPQPAAPVAIPTGMFQLPPAETLPTVQTSAAKPAPTRPATLFGVPAPAEPTPKK